MCLFFFVVVVIRKFEFVFVGTVSYDGISVDYGSLGLFLSIGGFKMFDRKGNC